MWDYNEKSRFRHICILQEGESLFKFNFVEKAPKKRPYAHKYEIYQTNRNTNIHASTL